MGLFANSNMNETKGAGGSRGLTLAEGSYTLTLRECKGVQTRKKVAACDFVFEVTSASVEGSSPVGTTVNEFCLEDNDIGLMYLKTVIVCLMGLDENLASDKPAVKAEDWNKVRDSAIEGLLNGRKIECVVVLTEYKKARTDGKTSYLRRNYAPNAEVRAKTLAALAKASK
jgi:hypothetical protein